MLTTVIMIIIALVVGFCIGATRSLETTEVKRLTTVHWETKTAYDELVSAHEEVLSEFKKTKLELLKLKKELNLQESKICQLP